MSGITVLAPVEAHPAADVEHWEVADLVEKIKRACVNARTNAELAQSATVAFTAHAIEVGRDLVRLKQIVPHGQFEVVSQRRCGLASSTARAYMSIFRRLQELSPEERQRVSVLPVRQAIAALATTGEVPPKPPRSVRQPDYKAKSKREADAVVRALRSSVRAINQSARYVEGLGEIKRKDLDAIRARVATITKLLDRIDTLDEEFGGADAGSS